MALDMAEDQRSSSLEHDLLSADKTFDTTMDDRKFLAQKLRAVIEDMNITPNDKDSISGQLGLVNVYTKVLNDMDKNKSTRAMIKLKKAEEENHNNNFNELVAAVLTSCRGGPSPFLRSEHTSVIDVDIEQVAASHELTVEDTELKSDPYDFRA